MPCRVGITTDLEARRAYWEGQVEGLKNWRHLKTFSTKEEAQEYETDYADRYGCVSHGGGPVGEIIA